MAVSKLSDWGNALYTGRKNYKIVPNGKYFVISAIALCAAAALFIFLHGFNLGIEFKGGSEFTISGVTDKTQQIGIDAVHKVEPKEEPIVTNVGDSSVKIQVSADNDENAIDAFKKEFAKTYKVDEKVITVNTIGPSWGEDLSNKAVQGLFVFLIVVALFMWIYFRNFHMALAGIIALINDLLVTVGVYALSGWEITPASMIGFLTILGYSMYDTVVVFDKLKENTEGYLDQSRSTYAELSNMAVNQTLIRSINTSVVALLPVASILFVGVFMMGTGTLRDIALALFVGMFVGTYSSIFLATPMNVWFRKGEKKMKAHTEYVLRKRAELIANSGLTEEELLSSDFTTPNIQLIPGQHKGMQSRKREKK